MLSWDLRREDDSCCPPRAAVWRVTFESQISFGDVSLWIELFRKVSQTFQSMLDAGLGLELELSLGIF